MTDVIGYESLARHLNRPAASLRAAHSVGLLPIDSRIEAGVRVFDGSGVQVLAEILAEPGAL